MTPDTLMQMFQGHQVAAIIRSAIELGTFDALTNGPLEAPAVAERVKADQRGVQILLGALASLGLLDHRNGGYELTPIAKAHLVSSSPAYLGDMARLMGNEAMWEGFRRLGDAVRHGGTVLETHAETPRHPFWTDFARWTSGMARPAGDAIAKIIASWASQRVPLEVLDAACGTGLYGFTVAKNHPQARVTSLDWPNVIPIAREHAERMEIIDRVQFIEGDMFECGLGGPYDLVIFSHVFHHFSKPRSTQLLQRIAKTIKPNGRVVIHDFVSGDNPFADLFSVNMLVWTSEGEAYPLERYEGMLAETGFGKPQVHPSAGMPSTILIADRR